MALCSLQTAHTARPAEHSPMHRSERTASEAMLAMGRHSSTACHTRWSGSCDVVTASGTHQGTRSPGPSPQRCTPATVKGACTCSLGLGNLSLNLDSFLNQRHPPRRPLAWALPAALHACRERRLHMRRHRCQGFDAYNQRIARCGLHTQILIKP